MSIRSEAMRMCEEGYSQTDIAAALGVSRQRVHQITGGYHAGHFKKFTEKQVVYPNLRNWLNENRMTKKGLLDRLGLEYHSRTIAVYSSYLCGRSFPPKKTIDKLLEMTGLTYEQLFYMEGD